MRRLESTIVYLIGYPGVGKLTTAKDLSSVTGSTLVDNHMANNPIFKIIGADGITPIPEAAWDRVKAVRDILFDTILNITPRHSSFVFTNVLLDDEGDRALFDQVQKLAENRGSIFVPVVLHCEEEEHYQRIVSPERSKNMKDTSVSSVKRLMRQESLISITHPHLLKLDNTSSVVEESTETIVEHIKNLQGKPLGN